MENNNSKSFLEKLSWEDFFKSEVRRYIDDNLKDNPYSDLIPDEYRDLVVNQIFSSNDINLTYQETNLSISGFMESLVENSLNNRTNTALSSMNLNWNIDEYIKEGNKETTSLIINSFTSGFQNVSDYIFHTKEVFNEQYKDYQENTTNSIDFDKLRVRTQPTTSKES